MSLKLSLLEKNRSSKQCIRLQNQKKKIRTNVVVCCGRISPTEKAKLRLQPEFFLCVPNLTVERKWSAQTVNKCVFASSRT